MQLPFCAAGGERQCHNDKGELLIWVGVLGTRLLLILQPPSPNSGPQFCINSKFFILRFRHQIITALWDALKGSPESENEVQRSRSPNNELTAHSAIFWGSCGRGTGVSSHFGHQSIMHHVTDLVTYAIMPSGSKQHTVFNIAKSRDLTRG